jgi:hypothetical protein
MTTHASPKTTQFVTRKNMAIIPHPSYSLDLVPCDFALFPKLKMKLEGRCFETVSDIQRKSQAALDSIKQNNFHSTSEAWGKNEGIAVHIPNETILEMATITE